MTGHDLSITEQRHEILYLLAETPMPVSQPAVLAGLLDVRDVELSRRTLQTRLYELRENGLVEHVDIDMNAREITVLDDSSAKGYWRISEGGRQLCQSLAQ